MYDDTSNATRAVNVISEFEAKQLSPLALAYIGDAVFETYVREIIVLTEPSGHTYEMHKRAISVVKATSQAEILKKLNEMLVEDEQYIVRRGKNAKPHSMPKNADILEYKLATAFEALIGYLYITGKNDRLAAVLKKSCEVAGLLFTEEQGV